MTVDAAEARRRLAQARKPMTTPLAFTVQRSDPEFTLVL